MEIIKINNVNLKILEDFLLNKLSTSFRYFSNRSIECIKNHILTIIIQVNEESVGYAHIDKYNDIYWLGICFLDKCHGQGLASKTMEFISEYIKTTHPNIKKISLTVDIDNLKAIKLYNKFNFQIVENLLFTREYCHYMEKLIT